MSTRSAPNKSFFLCRECAGDPTANLFPFTLVSLHGLSKLVRAARRAFLFASLGQAPPPKSEEFQFKRVRGLRKIYCPLVAADESGDAPKVPQAAVLRLLRYLIDSFLSL